MSNFRENVLNLISSKKSDSIASQLSLMEYELKIISFISALNSYKADSLLKPFPKDFQKNNTKDFDELRRIAKLIPKLSDIDGETILSDDCWKLMHWILTAMSIELQLLDKKETEDLYRNLSLSRASNDKILPHFIFKLNAQSARTRHKRLKDENGHFKAYHGTKFENLHSIIHNGLINNLNKRDVFGSGTYLSKDLNVAITFSPYTYLNFNSSIERISCILLCDVVQHPSIVVKENSTYCLVQDDDLVNVTHILVYCQMGNNEPRPFMKFELLLLLLGMVVVLYSIYKSNHRY